MKRLLGTGAIFGVILGSLLTVNVEGQGPYSAQIQRALNAFVGAAHTWTSAQTTSLTGLGTTSTDGELIQNTTAATAGVTVQISPRSRWCGSAWNSVAVASETNCFYAEVLPVTAAGTTSATWRLGSTINGGAATFPLTLTSGGGLFTALNVQTNTYYFGNTGGAALQSLGSATTFNVLNASGNGFGVDVGTDAVFKIRNRAQNAYATVDALAYNVQGNAFGTGTIGPSSPTGTTSTALVMAGLAGAITTRTGRVQICASGNLSDNTANDGTKAQISYGTGTAPVNGAALTGTQAGSIWQYSAASLSAAASGPFGGCVLITGLSSGTAYWFDLAFAAITGGTGSVISAYMEAHDIP